ncbi:tegument protein [Phascolarctid gammaherpesvirus 1]|uniref:Tegument protein n=1 Tax=Phascolarctid gammaherpesvirus 1 TaxID=2249313 RepID=A0A3S8D7V5_9GAMA|nr:tegument protein [Phascolarctid gammaherpesvirus 1]AZB49236.1 tegument protein [Phascolarctid gammaherpesvirus 1]
MAEGQGSLVIRATAPYNQAHETFGIHAGSQCVSNATMFLLCCHHRQSPLKTVDELLEVLDLGTTMDRELRKKGVIKNGEYAQLVDIPNTIRTDKWSYRIMASIEFHGMIGSESGIKEEYVISLRDLLETNTSGPTKYLVVICNNRAVAVLISSGQIYVFDPHGSNNLHIPGAFIASSFIVSDILGFIGGVVDVYTACFLYPVPESLLHSSETYMLDTYRILAPRTHNDIVVDMSTNYGHTCGTETCEGVTFEKVSNDLIESKRESSRKRLKPCSVTSLRHSSSGEPPQDKKWKVGSSADGQTDDDLSDGGTALFITDSEFSFDSGDDVFIDDELQELGDSDEEILDMAAIANVNRDYHTLEFTAALELDDGASSVLQKLDQLSSLKHQGEPVITDSHYMKSPKDVTNIQELERCLYMVVLESGVVVPPSTSKVLNLLRFIIICLQRLSLEYADCEKLLEGGLDMHHLYATVCHKAFRGEDLLYGITDKVNRCLRTITNLGPECPYASTDIIGNLGDLASESLRKSHAIDVKAIIDKAMAGKSWCILPRNDWDVLSRLISALKIDVERHNHMVKIDEERYRKILDAVLTGTTLPPDTTLEFLDEERLSEMEIAVGEVTDRLTGEVDQAIDVMIDLLKDDVITDIPDLHTLLQLIIITVKNIELLKDTMGLTTLDKYTVQMLNLGEQVSEVVGKDWPLETPKTVIPIHSIEKFKEIMEVSKQSKITEMQIDEIINSIENLLNAGGDMETMDIFSINVIENYLVTAHNILKGQTNQKIAALESLVKTLSTSHKFIGGVIDHMTFQSMELDAVRIREAVEHNRLLERVEELSQKIDTKLHSICSDLLKEMAKSDGHIEDTVLTAMHDMATMFNAQKSLVTISLLRELGGIIGEGPNGAFMSQRLTEFMGKVMNCNIGYSHRKEISKIVSNLQGIIQAEEVAQLKTQWWKHVEEIDPRDMGQVRSALEAAPTSEDREKAQKLITSKVVGGHKGSNVEAAVDLVMQENVKAIHAKVKMVFETLSFHHIDRADWAILMTTGSDCKQLIDISTILTKGLEKVRELINDSIVKKLRAIVLKVQDDVRPPSWMSDLEQCVLFHLGGSMNEHMPSGPAKELQRLIHVCRQVFSASELKQATAGTSLEDASDTFLNILWTVDHAVDDYVQKTRKEVYDFISTTKKNMGQDMDFPPPPKTIVPKSVLGPQNEERIGRLPEVFQSLMKDKEKMMLSGIKNEFSKLTQDIQALKDEFDKVRLDTKRLLYDEVTSYLSKSPPGVTRVPVDTNNPLKALEDIGNPIVLSKRPYGETVEVIRWLLDTCRSLMVTAPDDVTMRLKMAISIIEPVYKHATDLHRLELTIDHITDPVALDVALSDLEPSRMKGGKRRYEDVRLRKEQLEKAARAAIADTELATMLQRLDNESKVCIGLQELTVQIKEIEGGIQKGEVGGLKERNPKMFKDLTDLYAYLKWKRELVTTYMEEQRSVFGRHPPPKKISRKDLPIDRSRRLALLFALQKPKLSQRWIEITRGQITTLVPYGSKGKILDLCYVFDNVFDTFVYSKYICPHNIWGKRPISTVVTSKLGISASRLMISQWDDIQGNMDDVIGAYADNNLTLHVPVRDFIGMALVMYGFGLAVTNLDNRDTVGERTIRLTEKQWMPMLVSMFPYHIASALRTENFSSMINVLSTTIIQAKKLLPYKFLSAKVNKGKRIPRHIRGWGPDLPTFLFASKVWNPIQVEDSLWQQTSFMRICGSSPQRARIATLIWALQSLNKVVLEQLWASCKPANMEDKSVAEYVASLQDAIYGPLPYISKMAAATECEWAGYGAHTGEVIEVVTSSGGVKVPPLSAFEVAVACMLFRTRAELFVTTEEALFSDRRLGAVRSISRLLDCDPTVEPYKSMFEAPRRRPGINVAQEENACTVLETELLSLQVDWLQDLYGQNHTGDKVVVLVGPDNHVLQAFEPSPDYIKNREIDFTFSADLKSLPRRAFYQSAGSLQDALLGDIKAIQESVHLDNIFSVFPEKLSDTGPSMDGPCCDGDGYEDHGPFCNTLIESGTIWTDSGLISHTQDIPPDVSLPVTVPTIQYNPIRLTDITLVQSQPQRRGHSIIIPIEETLGGNGDLFTDTVQEKRAQTSKDLVLGFIYMIKTRVKRSTDAILDTIQRIKLLYLFCWSCYHFFLALVPLGPVGTSSESSSVSELSSGSGVTEGIMEKLEPPVCRLVETWGRVLIMNCACGRTEGTRSSSGFDDAIVLDSPVSV